jgi:hypothetical protein
MRAGTNVFYVKCPKTLAELQHNWFRYSRIVTCGQVVGKEDMTKIIGAESCSSGQEISLLLWNTKVHFRLDNSPPLVPILSRINLLNSFNIIHQTTSRFSEWYLSFSFSYRNFVWMLLLLSAYYLARSSLTLLFDCSNNILIGNFLQPSVFKIFSNI